MSSRWIALVLVAAGSLACTGELFKKAAPTTGGSTGFTGSGTTAGAGGGNGTGGGGGGAITLVGTVTDAQTSVPVANASISVGSVVTQSDPSGRYALTARGSGDVVVNATDATHAPMIAIVRTKPGTVQYTVPIKMTPMTSQTVSPAGGTLTFSTWHGHTVTMTIPANAFPDAGTVRMRVASFDPKSGPGVLEPDQATASGGNALQSTAMFYFDAVDANGNPVTPAPNVAFHTAEDTVSLDTFPDTENVQGWQLNAQGKWASAGNTPPGAGPHPRTVATPSMDPSQFGYWNSDRAFRTACVIGHLASPGGACSGQHVDGLGPDGIVSSDNSGSDGAFCIQGAQTVASTVSVGSGSGMSVAMPANAGDCAHPSTCRDLGTVNVAEADCPHPPDAGSADGGSCFPCGNGTCIDRSLVCNQNNDCGNNADEDPNICGNQASCCIQTNSCPGETGSSCAATCCCCPGGQACCADPTQGCCASP